MATRPVTATIRHSNGTPWAGGVIEYKLEKSTYDTTDQYPTDPIRATANGSGLTTVTLWCNADGVIPAQYKVRFPDSSTDFFVLAAGSGSVDLSVLRQSSQPFTPSDPTYSAIQALVDAEAVTRANADADLQTQIDDFSGATSFTSLTGTLSDAQHSTRAGGNLHAVATDSVAGFMSAADKTTFDGLASVYQPLSAALTAFVALTPTDNDVLQRKAGAWINRSLAQLKTDLALSSANISDFSVAVDARISYPVTSVNGHSGGAVSVTKSDVGLGNVDNVQQMPLSYLDTDGALTANSDVKVASQKAVVTALATNLASAKTYADGLVVGLLDDRGNYDASGNVFPSSGGSGSAGAVLKGDLWYISVAGTLGGVAVSVGSSIRALVNTPGQTAGNWDILNAGLGYIPLNSALNLSDLNSASSARTNIGLGSVDNTADTAKPISTATQTALNLKANSASLATVATSGAYADLSGKPTLGTLAAQNGTFSGTSSGTNTGDQTNISGNAATVTTNANLTGPITSVGNATSIASQTGTGTKFVMDTSPSLVTPTLGVASVTSINKLAITAPATSATLAIADGKTLTVSNTLTLAGTDTSTLNISGGGTLGSNAFNSTAFLTANQTVTLSGDVSGSGATAITTTIGANKVTLAMQAQLVANSVIGNSTSGSATPTAVSMLATATASSLAFRDANANLLANNFQEGYTTTATAAGTTVLTVGSTYQQFFTGATTQTVTLPVASTLVLGFQFLIVNNSTGLVTVNSSGNNAVIILPGSTSAVVTCILASGTNAASWSASYIGDVVATGKKLTVSNSLTLAGTDSTTMTFPSTSATIARTDAANTFSGVQTMTSPVVNTNLSVPIIMPPSNSTTALKLTKADGSTAVVTLDTTNARLGINKTPGAFDLDVNGAINTGGSATFGGNVTVGGNGMVVAATAIQAPSTGLIYWQLQTIMSSPANGSILFQNQAQSQPAGILGGRVVTAKTTNYSIAAATDSNTLFTNTGAAGEVDFTLPTAVAGQTYTFYVDVAQTLKVIAGASTTIRVAGSVSASAGNITNSTIGGCVRLTAISSTKWIAEYVTGTWTVT